MLPNGNTSRKQRNAVSPSVSGGITILDPQDCHLLSIVCCGNHEFNFQLKNQSSPECLDRLRVKPENQAVLREIFYIVTKWNTSRKQRNAVSPSISGGVTILVPQDCHLLSIASCEKS